MTNCTTVDLLLKIRVLESCLIEQQNKLVECFEKIFLYFSKILVKLLEWKKVRDFVLGFFRKSILTTFANYFNGIRFH